MRENFCQALLGSALKDKRIILLTGDLGYTVFEPFFKYCPKQIINAGVAEANILGIACGMALSGLIPFVYSIATFVTMRGYEQIRSDICLHNANVKIVGTGAGLSYGHGGSTHHALEDLAILRPLPSLTIICPSDRTTTHLATLAAVKHQGPVYLRLGKKGEPDIYTKKPPFKMGKAIHLKEGKHAYIVATGNIVHNALLAVKILEKKGLSVGLLDMHTIKPFDRPILNSVASRVNFIFTVEEHFLTGGLGSVVAEYLSEMENKNVLLKRIGIPDCFVSIVGSQEYLRDYYQLSPEKLAASVFNFINSHD